MSLVSFLLNPIATYLELTVTEPCRNIKQVRREKKVVAAPEKRFSLLSALRNQKRNSSPDDESTPLVHIHSVTEHYYRDWH
ncbi:MAG: hypothetical protein U0136_02635 [Bdellovibrionota bacterium]